MEEGLLSVAPACNSTTTNALLNNHCADDSISAASASDVQDRLSSLELRVQQQEDEITVMKAALADVLRRLALSEDTAATGKKQTSTKGQNPLREAYSMSCIANGSSSSRKPSHRDRDSSTVSVARKETFSSAAKSGQTAERKKDTPQMEGIKEKQEGPSQPNQANDKAPPASPLQPSPSPSSSSHPLSPHPPQSQRQAPESKGTSPAKRGHSAKRGTGMERSQSSTWESGEESRNKLVKAASTSKLLAKVVKNADKHKDPVISQAKMSTREKNSQAEGDYIKMFMRGRPITMFIPADVENYDDVRTELPPERLKLEWVYGYRGKDCRANVYLLPTGESVYFIASVVVLFNYEERTQRHYLGHTDSVKCLAVHPDKIRIATGQIAGVDKDGRPLQPHVRVWDSVSLSTLQVIGLGTFERGVGSLAFSKADSGTHLAVIDDCNDHMLTVWDWQKKSKIAEIKSTNEVVLVVEFHPTDANTIVTCGKSHIFFWTWAGTSLARKQGIFGKYEKPKFVQCLAFLNNGDILTGDSGGIMLIWSRSTVEPTPGKGPKGAYQISRQIKAHDGSVFTLCQMRNGTLLTGGGKDHKIILWDHDLNPERDIEVPDQYGTIRAVAEGKGEQFLVGTSRNFILRGTFNDGFQVEVQGHIDELWGLASHPFKDLFLTCAQDRQVCLWNSVDHSLEWTRLLDEHGHCADFHPSGAVVAIGTHSGKWYALDAETRDLVAIHTDGNEQLSVMRFSVDGTLLAVGSHDNFIYLHTVSEKGRKYTRCGKCIGHSSYITHLDWSPDNKFIMSNSGDYEILYWDIPNGCKYIRNRSECKDIDWATYTCVLGYHVFGVWPEGSDGTDINALIRSHNRKVIALADDFCKVHLFQYPCARPKAPSHKYSAHSSHVTNVTFMHNDSHLVSTGGKDTSVMQWRLVEKTPSLVPSDSSLSLGEGLLHNSTPRAAIPAVPLTPTPTEPAAMPTATPTPPTVLDLTSDPPAAHCEGVAIVTPPPTPTSPTTNGRQESSPETPPPAELTPPPSDSTLSLKDSLDPSDDTATPSDEGRPFTPPS
ncbi:echinoderm microtubule-associated protein-like 4 isoform X1 [Coregonus clupeaformis]|uniref:echinoderm microtubule-associated protein-like 4 isoform X1 n=1 Tax=Coregonus clupeaformis TaxID=59861 RepID=UPI001E1C9583|nr:echinoderm microtubule-associated protein-like 4 isoform X1 [Coregonus clupeaformis]